MRKNLLLTSLALLLLVSLAACTKHIRIDQDREAATQGIQFH
jgi:hypothetical protein